jgi:Lrp/AsnC family leucine-responsive transcriptional regulator
MTLEKTHWLDGIDLQILTILETDGRITIKQLAQKIDMSAPSVNERLRRLQSRAISA